MAICITAGTRPKWGSRYRSRHRRCQCGALSHCHLIRARFYTASARSGHHNTVQTGDQYSDFLCASLAIVQDLFVVVH